MTSTQQKQREQFIPPPLGSRDPENLPYYPTGQGKVYAFNPKLADKPPEFRPQPIDDSVLSSHDFGESRPELAATFHDRSITVGQSAVYDDEPTTEAETDTPADSDSSSESNSDGDDNSSDPSSSMQDKLPTEEEMQRWFEHLFAFIGGRELAIISLIVVLLGISFLLQGVSGVLGTFLAVVGVFVIYLVLREMQGGLSNSVESETGVSTTDQIMTLVVGGIFIAVGIDFFAGFGYTIPF